MLDFTLSRNGFVWALPCGKRDASDVHRGYFGVFIWQGFVLVSSGFRALLCRRPLRLSVPSLLANMDPYSLQKGVPLFLELSSSREVVQRTLLRVDLGSSAESFVGLALSQGSALVARGDAPACCERCFGRTSSTGGGRGELLHLGGGRPRTLDASWPVLAFETWTPLLIVFLPPRGLHGLWDDQLSSCDPRGSPPS